MNTLFLDLFSGISGDMFLGAMLDLGVDAHQLEHELAKLGVKGYHLHVARRTNGGIAGIKFDVHLESEHHHDPAHPHHDHDGHSHSHAHSHSHPHDHGHPHPHDEARTFAAIRQLIQASALDAWVKTKAVAIFQRVAEAEGRIHGQPAEAVHFHEVGALDSIVDIVGACIALDLLGRPRVLASGVVEGTGSVKCAHGRLPLPAPATLDILMARGVQIRQCEEPGELVTPTGAALVAEFAETFGPMHDLKPVRIGFGLGTRQNKTRPNVLRAILAESAPSATHDWETDAISVLETNLDDLSGEILGSFVERALAAGALDVFHTPVQMKKNRPGVLLTVLCARDDADRFTEMILRETSAFGVRRTVAERRKLRREITQVETEFGPIAVKLGWLDGQIVQAAPEFESCRKAAQAQGVPVKAVFQSAVAAAKRR